MNFRKLLSAYTYPIRKPVIENSLEKLKHEILFDLSSGIIVKLKYGFSSKIRN